MGRILEGEAVGFFVDLINKCIFNTLYIHTYIHTYTLYIHTYILTYRRVGSLIGISLGDSVGVNGDSVGSLL